MKIKFFTPHWGYEHIDFQQFCLQVANSGFDGIELNLATDLDKAEAQLRLIEQPIANQWDINLYMKERLSSRYTSKG